MKLKEKEKKELIYYVAMKEDHIADMFSSGGFSFSAFDTWVTDHGANIYTLRGRIRGCLDK